MARECEVCAVEWIPGLPVCPSCLYPYPPEWEYDDVVVDEEDDEVLDEDGW